VRHRRKVRDPVDTFSMSRTIEAIRRCDLALKVLDAAQGVVSDDKRIVATVCAAGRGLLLLVNKWDLVRGGRERALVAGVRQALPHAAFAPVLAVSAKTGFQVPRLLATMLRVIRAIRAPRADAACLALLERAWAAHPPPRIRGRTIRLRRVRWVPGLPARLELSVSPIGRLLPPYQHYLLKCLCAQPAFAGIPMRLVVKAYENRKQSSVTSGDGVARFVHR
jgi:GTP-binding protein